MNNKMLVAQRVRIKLVLRALFFIIIVSLAACESAEQHDYQQGLKKAQSRNYEEAIVLFEQSILRNPRSQYALLAAKEGARVSYYEIKNFIKAVEFLKQTVVNSSIQEDRLQAQKMIAKIYFENLTDYQNSIIEINKLISMIYDPQEKIKLRENLARSYFYLNNFSQAQSEADELIKNSKDKESQFQMLVLKGNIYLAKKDVNQAAIIFQEIMKQYPERAVKENIASTLAVAYEEMKDYKSAIQVLEAMKPHHNMPEYIDLRIKRLLQNQKNQPGAKGMRRK